MQASAGGCIHMPIHIYRYMFAAPPLREFRGNYSVRLPSVACTAARISGPGLTTDTVNPKSVADVNRGKLEMLKLHLGNPICWKNPRQCLGNDL